MPDWLARTIFSAAGSVIDGWAWLSGEASNKVVNDAVGVTRTRPHPWSTFSDYTSWQGLTDRTYLARHLPPADVPVKPPEAQVRQLFQRPAGQQRLSKKSTCLFPAFAQNLTDGFIRTMPSDTRRTTSNHEIDLCPLYGRIPAQTAALRLNSNAAGQRGRLKSQLIGTEEYPPFLYPHGGHIGDPAFEALDPPLMLAGTPTPPAELATIFAFGGDRANSTPFTAMMNTLLLREHNRIAGELERRNPAWDDERIFQTARNILIPVFIKIVVEQYINHITPLPFSLRAEPSVAWTANWNRPNWMTAEFSLLYRWHSLMPDNIQWPGGDILIADFTFDNTPLLNVGLDAAFSAAAAQPASELGAFNTADSLLRIEDFAVLQARHNRIDTYNAYRQAFGMPQAATFADISSDPRVVALLQQLYGAPENVEFYPGLFAEDRMADSPLPGLLMRMVAVDAFSQALTNPLLSEHVFNASTFTQWGLDLINSTSNLGDVLARNVTARGPTPIEMTQASWHYVNGP
ncbi:MAG TPA: peroxidase family protein [Acetobacteraceae bacterium]|nr:peroxidase family protein [Acetobacteraceae bacterium]